MTLLVVVQWTMVAPGLSWKQTGQCPRDKQPSRDWPGMQIGCSCSKIYSNFCFLELVGVDVRLFATRVDEEGSVDWGVVVIQPERWMHLASHNQNPPYFPTRKTTDWHLILFGSCWGVIEKCTYVVRADKVEDAYKCVEKALYWIMGLFNSVCFSLFILSVNPDPLSALSLSKFLFILFLVKTKMIHIVVSYKHNKHETPTRA